MPYSRITPTRNARAALNYALNGAGHNGHDERNIAVGTVGMLPPDVVSYAEQFERLLEHKSAKNLTEARRIIVSFSKNEIDPNDPEAGNRALQICQNLLDQYYHGFPAVICVQNDGKGGCVHVHNIVCNVNRETYKGFTDAQTKHYNLRDNVDTITECFVKLDYGQEMPPKDRTTQFERAMREQNEKGGEQVYIWKDDLKNRVRECMKDAVSREDFERLLIEHGVEPEYHKPNKAHTDGYYTYELIDPKEPVKLGNTQRTRARSYNLGDDYDIAAIDSSIELNQKIVLELKSRELHSQWQNFEELEYPTSKPKKQEQEEQEPQEPPTAPTAPEPEPDYLFMQPNVQEDDDSASEQEQEQDASEQEQDTASELNALIQSRLKMLSRDVSDEKLSPKKSKSKSYDYER